MMKVATKLILLFLLLATVPLAVVGYLAYDNGMRAIEQNVENHLISVNLFKRDEFNRWVRSNEYSLELLAGRKYFLDEFAADLAQHDLSSSPAEGLTPEHQAVHDMILRDYLLPRLGEKGGFLELSLLRVQDGLVLISTDENLVGKFRESEPFFVEGKTRSYTQNVSYSLSQAEIVMYVSTPVKDRQGELLAVLAGRVDLAELSEIMEQGKGLSQSEDTYLVNAFNFFVTEPRFGEGYALKKAIRTEGVESCLQYNDEVGLYQDYRGVEVIGAYRWLPERELCILTEVDQAEAYASIVALRNNVLAIAGGTVLAAFLLSIFLARGITRPVRQLAQGAGEIGRGNLDYRIPAKRGDEIGQLAGAFNQMAADLRQSLQENARAAEALYLANERLNYLISSSPTVIYTSKASGDYGATFISENVTELMGYEPQDFTADPGFWANHIHPEDAPRVFAELPQLYEHDRYSHEYRFLHKDGAYRWVHDGLILARDENGEPLETIGSWSDVTEQKEMQARLVRSEKLAILGQLAGGVSHELRNPLGVIKNAVYFLNMVLDASDPKIKEMLEILTQEVAKSERIISDLLDFARTKPPIRRKVAINEVIQETLSLIEVPGNIQVISRLEQKLPLILADPGQLDQIFSNIIHNGIQAMTSSSSVETPEGGQLTIETRLESQEWLAVTIADTGVGISPENMEKIFEPLFTTKAKGIGLGLAIVKTLVEGHGGTIEAESEGVPGEGSRFTVKLPLQMDGAIT
jgi:PAS domain S-box-containing protein